MSHAEQCLSAILQTGRGVFKGVRMNKHINSLLDHMPAGVFVFHLRPNLLHVAKFYGRIRLIRASKFSVLKSVEIVIWVTAVTPTDRPKSVHNRCVIEVFVAFFMLSRCFLDFSVRVGAFVIGLSQISSFCLLWVCYTIPFGFSLSLAHSGLNF